MGGEEKVTREVRLDAGKYEQMGLPTQENREIRSSGGGGNDFVPCAERHYRMITASRYLLQPTRNAERQTECPSLQE